MTDHLPFVRSDLVGSWRITEMSEWDQDTIDLMGPAFIIFDDHGLGLLGFIAVEGGIDWEPPGDRDPSRVDFTWVGFDDNDEASGAGWVTFVEPTVIAGRITFHQGMRSTFRAVRDESVGPR
ncbi:MULTISPECIES: hypothetical protein [Gordonia]|jgi:hypothetical protein|uniref:hypothetical protein n=1 Tax=Gordonia TaxID=2053 RepID=UPI0032B51187